MIARSTTLAKNKCSALMEPSLSFGIFQTTAKKKYIFSIRDSSIYELSRMHLSTGKDGVTSQDKKEKGRALVKTMRQKLQEDTSSRNADGWDELWKESVTPWDINMPTPVLKSELQSATSNSAHGRYSILVPGCGSGFDLISMAEHLDVLQARGVIQEAIVIGLDISSTSLKQAEKMLQSQRGGPLPHIAETRKTRIVLAKGDFFNCSSWQDVYATGARHDGEIKDFFAEYAFDIIYDYVFFCALSPDLRESWGEAISTLLKPKTGRLLTLMFPVVCNDPMKGPPYPVTPEDYKTVLESRGVFMETEPYTSVHTIPERQGKELVCWWRKRQGGSL